MEKTRIRILFMDEDEKVLKGLQRSLRSMRSTWEMYFASTMPKIKGLLNSREFDFCITDIRHKGIDGIGFLKKLRDNWPGVVRIILSGETDQAVIMKSALHAHQFIAKPCDVNKIKSVVSKTSRLKQVVHSKPVEKIVSKIGTLPSLPLIYAELMGALEAQDTSVKKIGRIISGDQSMSIKVLQLVNSSFFGLGSHVSDPGDAVSFLGLETIKSLVLSVCIFDEFNSDAIPLPFMNQLWEHSRFTGFLARDLARRAGQDKMRIENCFAAGLLHDCGRLIFLYYFTEEYIKIVAGAKKEQVPIHRVEKEVLGITHAEVGAYLAGLWGLSTPIVGALAFHHNPSDFPCKDFSTLSAVYTADMLLHEAAGYKLGPIDPEMMGVVAGEAGDVNDLKQLAWDILQGNAG